MGDGERVRYQTVVTDSARWDGFVFRPGDIVISTPAKCGTTWLQMICALEIFQHVKFDRPLDLISPWLDVLTRPLGQVLADLEAQVRYIAGRLGIAISETAWPDLVRAATFDGMKGRAGELAPEASHDGFYYDRAQFFHSGSTGQWRQVVSEEELPRYAARVAECAPADLATWIHRPPLPSASRPG